jgi:hypothetical protein
MFLILRRIQQNMINVQKYSYRVTIIFNMFRRENNFRHRFSKYSQISNFIQIFSVGEELAHTDGRKDGRVGGQPGRQTDMTKLIVAVRNFSKAPKDQE